MPCEIAAPRPPVECIARRRGIDRIYLERRLMNPPHGIEIDDTACPQCDGYARNAPLVKHLGRCHGLFYSVDGQAGQFRSLYLVRGQDIDCRAIRFGELVPNRRRV